MEELDSINSRIEDRKWPPIKIHQANVTFTYYNFSSFFFLSIVFARTSRSEDFGHDVRIYADPVGVVGRANYIGAGRAYRIDANASAWRTLSASVARIKGLNHLPEIVRRD